jgi:hypothetical protein
VSPLSRAETRTGERCHGTDSHAQNDVIIEVFMSLSVNLQHLG